MIIFDWDENKERANIEKHSGVDFIDASLAAQDDFALEEYDQAHSTAEEKRFSCIGSTGRQVLYVIYTVRDEGTENEVYRIITARLAEPDERESYEQEKFNSGYFG